MKNVDVSIRAKLLNLSREKDIPLNALTERYAIGRFLYRLSQSSYRERFILKGAQLFRVWNAEDHRPTRDIDFLGYGEPSPEAIREIFTELTQADVEPPDGLIWGNIDIVPIREDVVYGGIRAKMKVHLAGARFTIQIDVGFGDAITPRAEEKEWNELLSFPSARLLAYPAETVIAEKLQAMVSLGMNNSRMKDFYDLHWLQSHLNFQGEVLTKAVVNTFERRETVIPESPPVAFTTDFTTDTQKNVQWTAFLRKGKLPPSELPKIMEDVSQFLLPVLKKEVTKFHWIPSGGWKEKR